MDPTSPRTSQPALKRSRDDASPPPGLITTASPPSATPSIASTFRNVSACNRCRLRKNRCDQRLPACASCEKADVKCVGYDPITKREIPRSYVYYLETRVTYLESLLQSNGVQYSPAETLDLCSRPGVGPNAAPTPSEEQSMILGGDGTTSEYSSSSKKENEAERLDSLVSNIGMVSVQGASDPRYLGSTSGISFARVVFAAVKQSVSSASSERTGVRPSKPINTGTAAAGGTSMRDSFFGLQSKPHIKPAPFPDEELGWKLVNLYFEHANCQIPILHRGEFEKLIARVYRTEESNRTSRELYMSNIVFAIGAGIIFGSSDQQQEDEQDLESPITKKRRLSNHQAAPEEYHASAIVHLESFLGSATATDRPEGFGGGLEELQAVLLLASFALLRPVAPGLWYIVGVAVRLAIDLGLHYEDGLGVDAGNEKESQLRTTEDVAMDSIDGDYRGGFRKNVDAKEKGRREWVRDLRRRCWWCVYSFDRLVSTCVGRPFGITDQVVTTEFPSLLDDRYITTGGFLTPEPGETPTSYKHVAHHYVRLRLLQSEILQVLQHQQAQHARAHGANMGNKYMHTKLPSPFLSKFDSFRSWRRDIDRRLWEWKESAPTKVQTGVEFSHDFLELNYWQTIIMLYRQSLSVPLPLASEVKEHDKVESPSALTVELREDEEGVCVKVAEAGERVLRLYRQLHRMRYVNYTFLATHHLFMAGISFLYAIWHSTVVRSRLSLDDVDFTVLAATSVLTDLIDKCPPAEACRDAFSRMSKATVQMCMSTTGFGSQAIDHSHHHHKTRRPQPQPANTMPSQDQRSRAFENALRQQQQYQTVENLRPPVPSFDTNLDMLTEGTGPNGNEANVGFDESSGPSASDISMITPPAPQYSEPFAQQQQQMIQPNTIPVYSPTASTSVDAAYNALPPSLNFGGIDFLDVNNGGTLDAANYQDPGGFQLGGWDFGGEGEHDWAEGSGLDLMDGFWFGVGSGGV